jgi:hypothetical protein
MQDIIPRRITSMPGQPGLSKASGVAFYLAPPTGGGYDFGGPDMGTAADFGAPADSFLAVGVVLPKQCA